MSNDNNPDQDDSKSDDDSNPDEDIEIDIDDDNGENSQELTPQNLSAPLPTPKPVIGRKRRGKSVSSLSQQAQSNQRNQEQDPKLKASHRDNRRTPMMLKSNSPLIQHFKQSGIAYAKLWDAIKGNQPGFQFTMLVLCYW